MGHKRSENQEHPESDDPRDSEAESLDALALDEPLWPDDFSEDEKGFARTLREFYSLEEENLPPLYVQTMLDAELHEPLSRGYTHKLTYHVMRRLELPRRPLTARRRLHLPNALHWRPGAPLITALSLMMALVLGSVYLATPSFAEGMRLLFGQTGARQIADYPTVVSKATAISQSQQATETAKAAWPNTKWLGFAWNGYDYKGFDLDQESWSNGPIVHLQYFQSGPSPLVAPNTTTQGAATQSSATPQATSNSQSTQPTDQGTHILDIREFQLTSQVNDVVLGVGAVDGSIAATTVNGQPAVYVNGMWVNSRGGQTSWQTGTRAMLMFEQDNTIYWIAGDQRDGVTEYTLIQIAEALLQNNANLVQLCLNDSPSRHCADAADTTLVRPMGINTDIIEVDPRGSGPSSTSSQFVVFNQPMTLQN